MGNSEARLHKMGGQGNKKKLDKQVKAIESRINQLEVKEKPKEEVQELDEIPQEEETPVKGKIIFSKTWLIVCGVLLFLIIVASIIVAFLPD